ncbi:MAG: PIN-like domain-containing protein [Actinomycetota bacterium]
MSEMTPSIPSGDADHGEGLGLFDGFEGYVTPTQEDYRRVLTSGLVIPDANVLLNLYRYTNDARDDLLAVLDRLGDRLWVPHQVLVEFWRNRESVLRDPRDTLKTVKELTDHRDKAVRAFQTWANRVSLASERSKALLVGLQQGFDAVMSGVDEFTDTSAMDSARDTNTDPVVERLEPILRGRVGAPMAREDHKDAVVEGLRRVDAQEPPGYKDKRKDDDGAAGDYLIWEQVLRKAERQPCNVLIVTGDGKEDWWREEGGERRGPRIELVQEMRLRSSCRLFMIRPTQLMDYARTALEVVVRDESVQDAERVDKFLAEAEATLPGGGWDVESVSDLLTRLANEAPVQEAAIRLAATQAGFVSREQVYKLGNYPEDRSLRGFTRPINRITQQFRDDGTVAEGAVDVLWTVYNEESPGVGWAAGFRVRPEVLPFIEPRPSSQEPEV